VGIIDYVERLRGNNDFKSEVKEKKGIWTQ